MAMASPTQCAPFVTDLMSNTDRTAVCTFVRNPYTKESVYGIRVPKASSSLSRVSDAAVRVGDHSVRRRRFATLQIRAVAKEAGTSTVVAEEVEFVWSGTGNEVLLTADFLNWDEKVPLIKGEKGVFQIKQKLAPGSYSYKFIVDGVWRHSPENPTVEDGTGGYNNVVVIAGASTPPASPPPKEPAAPKAEAAPVPKAGAPAGKAVGKAAGKKAAAKPIGSAMSEDIIPQLTTKLESEAGLSDLTLTFSEDQLRGSFLKGGVTYAFWCYFPDGKLEGNRGFSLATHGGNPSTVEPFLIDEKKITPELVVFWVHKRLFAQKVLSLN